MASKAMTSVSKIDMHSLILNQTSSTPFLWHMKKSACPAENMGKNKFNHLTNLSLELKQLTHVTLNFDP